MRVLALKAENFKRLKAVNITIDPHDPTVVVAGANAQGKTSVLDSIWAALGGAKASPADPIRHGSRTASVTLDLGDLRVTRKWHGGKTTLEVTNAAGGHLPGPQAVLDGLIGKLTFDPLQFALEKDAKKQLATLLDVVALPFDPAALAAERKRVYDNRTDVNREIKRLEGALASMPVLPQNVPDSEVSVSALLTTHADLKDALDRMARATSEWQGIETQIAALRERQKVVEADGHAAGQRIQHHLAESHASDGDERLAEIQQQMATADEVNKAVRVKQESKTIEADLTSLRRGSEAFTEEIATLDQRKVDGIAAASMPVPGLGFDDDGVTLNGVPFAQASAAEQLRTSTAIAMAAATARADGIRVILIRDASLLDSKNLALIAEMAAEHDFQVWLEKVDESGEVGIVIEDGEVA